MFDINSAITGFDKMLRMAASVTSVSRPNPADGIASDALSQAEQRHSAGLMRVNHVGEVCAQALYQAQSRLAHSPAIGQQFVEAGRQEQDHLGWTAERLTELGARPSLFNPLWYAAAYGLGTVAGRLGDAVSLGFVVETERQVEAHLASHLDRLPPADAKSRAIVDQMRQDEAAHGAHAQSLGASEVPAPVRTAMRAMSKVMTSVAYYI